MLIAGIAWYGYKTEGRGCVVIDQQGPDSSDIQYWPVALLKEMSVEEADHPGYGPLERYDPKTEAVIGFLLPFNDFDLWRVAAKDYGPLPPEAFKKSRPDKH